MKAMIIGMLMAAAATLLMVMVAPQSEGAETPDKVIELKEVDYSSVKTEEVKTGKEVNINTATAEQLKELKGVGPKKAAAIVKDRTENGLYVVPADLKRVKGIGPKTIEKNAALIVTE